MGDTVDFQEVAAHAARWWANRIKQGSGRTFDEEIGVHGEPGSAFTADILTSIVGLHAAAIRDGAIQHDDGTCVASRASMVVEPGTTMVRGRRRCIVTARLEPPLTACVRCGGTGHTFGVDDSGRSFAEPCSGYERQLVCERLTAALIPAHYDRAELSPTDPRHAAPRAAVAALASGSPVRGLWLVGHTRSGKTHAACAALREATRTHRGMFISVRELLGELRAGYGHDDAMPEQDILDSIATVPVLVLDDIRTLTGHEGRIITDLLDARCARLATPGLLICTSNRAIGWLGEHSGDDYEAMRALGRLGELCEEVEI